MYGMHLQGLAYTDVFAPTATIFGAVSGQRWHLQYGVITVANLIAGGHVYILESTSTVGVADGFEMNFNLQAEFGGVLPINFGEVGWPAINLNTRLLLYIDFKAQVEALFVGYWRGND